MAKILGIDLGTTFSAMAVIEAGEPKIIENKEGARTTPSVAALAKNGETLVGVQARRQQITNPENTISQVKRLMGRRFVDEVLRKLKADAEEKLGETITEAIITVPAYFDDSQRKETKIAGEIAGLEVKRVLNEPTAAALAYGLNKKKDEKIVVYDFGGGTFDISILEVSEDTIEVKATGGDTHLGGEDFDQKVMNWLVEQYQKEEGIDLANDPLALQRLKEAAEKAKIELSSSLETEVNLPFITSDSSGPKHLYFKMTRAQLEGLVAEYIDRSMALMEQTLKEAKVSVGDIDEIVLVGGQTRMPAIQEAAKKLFGKDPNRSINPDEVVALGAAVQGGILQGDVKDVLLLDVTPLSLGIETLGGVNTVLIAKNTTIPAAKSQVFSTAADNQTSVEVHVVQGERQMAQGNKSLGRFILDGIPPAQRGVPQVEVSFDIDANGILSVSAKDKASGKTQTIRIEGSSGISEEEVDRMRKDAEANEEEDKKKKDMVEVRNTAETLIYTVEKTLKDAGDKIQEEDKKDVEEKLDALRKVKDGEVIEDTKKATQELSDAIQKISASLYKEGEKPQEPQQEEGEVKEEEDKKPEGGEAKEE